MATRRKLSSTTKLPSVLINAEADRGGVIVRYAPRRGTPAEIEDRIILYPPGEMATVNGIGRLLRILRAARVRAPVDPYIACADPEHAAELLQRCRGTILDLSVARRYDRGLTLWTESGVERLSGVIDWEETPDALEVRRRGGRSILRIAKHTLIRYEPSSDEYYVVMSVDTL